MFRKLLYNKNREKITCRIKLLLSLLLLLALLFSPFMLRQAAASTGLNSPKRPLEYKDLSIYYYDYPGTYLGKALDSTFYSSDRIRLSGDVSLHRGVDNLIMLLSENQAYPFIRNIRSAESSSFTPLYRASLVIACDMERVEAQPRSWSDLTRLLLKNEDQKIGLFLDPAFLIASLKSAAKDSEDYARWLATFALPASKDNLLIFKGKLANAAWPLSLVLGDLDAQDLPPIIILWDYQAAQINLNLGEDRYQFLPPEEGSLSLDFGLFAQGAKAQQLIDTKLNLHTQDLLHNSLINNGYRLLDGSSAAQGLRSNVYEGFNDLNSRRNLGYPDESFYLGRQKRVDSYEKFNEALLNNIGDFRNYILDENRLIPANPEEEHVVISLFLPLFLIWIGSIFFRLDSPAIQQSMGVLLFWLGVAIIMYFVQIMYGSYPTGDVLYYIRLLPYFAIFEAWFFTGVNLARASSFIDKKKSKYMVFVSIFYYALAIAFILNDLHGLSYTLNPFKSIIKIGPLGYLTILAVLTLWISGFYLMLKYKARVYRYMVIFPCLAFFILLAGNFFFLKYDAGIRSSLFDLLNIISWALMLEISLQVKLIPANTGYTRLFSYSPVNLRFLSDDLKTIYPSRQDNISRNTMRKIREAIESSNLSNKINHFDGTSDASEDMSASLKVEDFAQNGIIYYISRLYGGYLIWEDDISEVQKLKRELSAINDTLEQQAKVLAKEKGIRSQYLSMRIREQILDNIERSIASQVATIKESLAEVQASNDMEFVRKELARVKIMVSQCKRKSNLLVRGEERIHMEEVQLIFNEVLKDAGTSGISGIAICRGEEYVPTRLLIYAYDYLQAILEKSVDLTGVSLFINVSYRAKILCLKLIFHAEEVPGKDFFESLLEKPEEDDEFTRELSLSDEAQDMHIKLELKEV